MVQKDNAEFYSELPVNEIRLSKLFARPHLFNDLPDDWYVIITDIEGSTEAISQGHHHDINMIATESIVAVLNIIYKNGIEIPFFFGGDGATFILPSQMLTGVVQVLSTHRENVLKNFGLKLRVGYVKVAEIKEEGFRLTIAKTRTSLLLSIPVILGDGINYVEKKIKGSDYHLSDFEKLNPEVDLQGMQCRWDQIDAPQDRDEVLSLVVMAKSEAHQPESFSQVIAFLDEIFGNVERRKAVTTPKLRLLTNFSRIKKQMQSQMKKYVLLTTTIEWVKTFIGKFYFNSSRGKQYLADLVQLTDDLVLDGKINTVISGTREQRLLLQAKLQKMEDDQMILFGLSVSDASVISCYVRDMYLKHIHFVDGVDGGYTKAGIMLKEKLRREGQI
jgi:hypothetical protein